MGFRRQTSVPFRSYIGPHDLNKGYLKSYILLSTILFIISFPKSFYEYECVQISTFWLVTIPLYIKE